MQIGANDLLATQLPLSIFDLQRQASGSSMLTKLVDQTRLLEESVWSPGTWEAGDGYRVAMRFCAKKKQIHIPSEGNHVVSIVVYNCYKCM